MELFPGKLKYLLIFFLINIKIILFPEFLQCRLDGRERVDEVHRRQSRVGGDIPVVILV